MRSRPILAREDVSRCAFAVQFGAQGVPRRAAGNFFLWSESIRCSLHG